MKISIEIDCTPEEVRAALGLPDVSGMQEQLAQELADRMRAFVQESDPETLLKTWMPGGGAESWERMQKAFWSGFTAPDGQKSE